MIFKGEKKRRKIEWVIMKNPFFMHVILFGQLFFKIIIALKSRKVFDTTEAKNKNKFGIYILSVPRNKELPDVRSYQKKVLALGSNSSGRY